MPVSQQISKLAKYNAQVTKSATVSRACRFCGQIGKDHIHHYSDHGQPACEEIDRRARDLDLLGLDQSLSPSMLLGLQDLGEPDTLC